MLCWGRARGAGGRGWGGRRAGSGGAIFVLTGLGGSEEEGVAKVSLLASWVKLGLAASVSDSASSQGISGLLLRLLLVAFLIPSIVTVIFTRLVLRREQSRSSLLSSGAETRAVNMHCPV